MRVSPLVLHLTTGLPGVGKTTLARQIEADSGALRLTPDEWMAPLFGVSDVGGKRDVLEGRLIWVAYRAVLGGLSAILDFGCWSPDERYAIRHIAGRAGADFTLHYLHLPEAERRRRASERWATDSSSTFEMSPTDHDRFAASFVPPTAPEVAGGPMPDPPHGHDGWASWACERWPSLPPFD